MNITTSNGDSKSNLIIQEFDSESGPVCDSMSIEVSLSHLYAAFSIVDAKDGSEISFIQLSLRDGSPTLGLFKVIPGSEGSKDSERETKRFKLVNGEWASSRVK